MCQYVKTMSKQRRLTKQRKEKYKNFFSRSFDFVRNCFWSFHSIPSFVESYFIPLRVYIERSYVILQKSLDDTRSYGTGTAPPL